MRNIINFKPLFWQSLCIAGSLILTVSCSENKTSDSKDVAERENVNRLTSKDTAVVIENEHASIFLVEAAELELEKIRLGKLAQQKGSSAHVKELGKMMEEDHNKTFNEIKALAQSKSVSIPTSITEDSQESINDLEEKSGNDFGKAYSDRMVEQHEDAIELYERAAKDSDDPEIRSWASEKLPSLRAHLKHAEASKEKSDNSN